MPSTVHIRGCTIDRSAVRGRAQEARNGHVYEFSSTRVGCEPRSTRAAARARPARVPTSIGARHRLDRFAGRGRSPVEREALPLDGVLARAVRSRASASGAPAPSTDKEILQRSYARQEGGNWVPKTDPAAEYAVLDTYVRNTATTTDIRADWVKRGARTLRSTLSRLMSTAERGEWKALFAEALGRRQPNRAWRFANEEQAARAVLGESFRNEGERKERELADEVLSSDVTEQIADGIHAYMDKLQSYLDDLRANNEIDDDFLSGQGIYAYYYQPSFIGLFYAEPTPVTKVLESHATYGIVQLIAAIKDVTTALFDARQDSAWIWHAVVTPADKAVGSSRANPSGSLVSEPITTIRPDVMDETSQSMRYVRRNRMLVDVGPSFTTGRAMQLGEAIGASAFEQLAVALGFFAFWNRAYWRGTSGIHHFHFVMDMLNNYEPGSYDYSGYPDSIASLLPAPVTS